MVVVPQESLSTALNARVVGTGQTTIVLAHGYGADQTVWDEVLPELGSLYRVVLFDWSFSGSVDRTAGGGCEKISSSSSPSSSSSSYEDFADELLTLAGEMGLADVVYVGHSMAAMVGCLASLKRPEVIRHLVLVGGSPRYLNSEDYHGGFSLEDIEALFANIELDFDQWALGFPSIAVGMHDPVSANKYRRVLMKMKPKTALSLAKSVFLSDYRSILEKIEVPCSIIQCSDDFIVPMSVVECMERKIKAKTTIEVIETYGHFPQLTMPNTFIDVLKKVVGIDLA